MPRVAWFLPPLLALLAVGCSTDNDFLRPGDSTILDDLNPADSPSARPDPHLWGTVLVQWFGSLPNEHGLKVMEYHVMANPTGGDIDEINWKAMTLLEVRRPGPSRRYVSYFDDRAGIQPGTPLSLVVRPRYEGGLWGPIGPVMTVNPTWPHTRGGTVRDDLGRPLPGVTVRLVGFDDHEDLRGFAFEQVTDAQGRFPPLGPIAHTASLIIETDSPDELTAPDAQDAWYDYRTAPLDFQADPGDLEICLIPKYPFDPNADGIHDWSTVELLQHLSFSRGNPYDTVRNTTYRTWDSYPLQVHIPEGTSHDGVVDLAREIRDAMGFWNTTLKQDLFIETPDPVLAQITCIYEEWPPSTLLAGAMRFVPQALGEGWGINEPARARLFMNSLVLLRNEDARKTARHELAHALGCYDHIWDTFALMYFSTASPTPLDYEVRLLKTLVGLPSLTEMNRYEGSYPDHPTW